MALKRYKSATILFLILSIWMISASSSCPTGSFECTNGICLSMAFVCDGEKDCPDGADESMYECEKHGAKTPLPADCPEDAFTCDDKLCIPHEWVCDGSFDCLDQSDENRGCAEPHSCEDGFRCSSGLCISVAFVCDGQNDCKDNSDEELCEEKDVERHNIHCESGASFLCTDGSKCISYSAVCNGAKDCDDGSDEGGKCFALNQCLVKGCPSQCSKTPSGEVCHCQDGYTYSNGKCEDFNECPVFGACGQLCDNTIGGYNCSCLPGYFLGKDDSTCLAEGSDAMIFVSNDNKIEGIYMRQGNITAKYFISTSHLTVGVSFDGDHLYWTNVGDRFVVIRALQTGDNQEIILDTGFQLVEAIAVDHVTKNIYLTDSNLNAVVVCSNDGSSCVAFDDLGTEKLRSIELYSERGVFYYTDWGSKPHIGRAGMDGSNPTLFVGENILWPNGIAIDHGTDRLYWVDGHLETIECIRLDGTGRELISKGKVSLPHSISVFEDRIYWTDLISQGLFSADKYTGMKVAELMKFKTRKVYGLHVYHSIMFNHQAKNPCQFSRCSHLCLLSPNIVGYTCQCPDGMSLNVDKHTCQLVNKTHSIVAWSRNTLYTVQLVKLGKLKINQHTLATVKEISSGAYDKFSGRLYVADSASSKIVAVHPTTFNEELIAQGTEGKITSMAVDHLGLNLFWIKGMTSLEMMSLKTGVKKTIISDFGGDEPVDITFSPKAGKLFVALNAKGRVHIDTLLLQDGLKNRFHLVEKNLVGPKVKLYYDESYGRVFVAEQGHGVISSFDEDASDFHASQDLHGKTPISVAVDQDMIYWTVTHQNTIFWANKAIENSHTFNHSLGTFGAELVGLAVTSVTNLDHSACQHLTEKNCDICLSVNDKLKCLCGDERDLQDDGLSCHPIKECKENEFRCSNGKCLDGSLTCDRNKDCENGEDEVNCESANTQCPLNKFPCEDGSKCIPLSSKCDFHYDCPDKSDEKDCHAHSDCVGEGNFLCGSGECISAAHKCNHVFDCFDKSDEKDCKLGCSPEEFQCQSGHCIPISWQCDTHPDCDDGSDEHDCKQASTCEPVHHFHCLNDRCIDVALKCDAVDDCGDGSDEIGCPPVRPKPREEDTQKTPTCDIDEFQCTSVHKCLPQDARCNGTAECHNGEDEFGCDVCKINEFKCLNRKCIEMSWRCDGTDDCGDGSDEHNCTSITRNINTEDCLGFHCKTSGECLSFHQVCDNKSDCLDTSDEGGLCGKSCQLVECSNTCHETPMGARCSCPKGFTLSTDGRTCVDINECAIRSSCSHFCRNSVGSFLCSCQEPGYTLRSDKARCKVKGREMEYIVVTDQDVRVIPSSQKSVTVSSQLGALKISDIDIDMKRRLVYWTSEIQGEISFFPVDKNEKKVSATKITNLKRPTRIALDWITGNIYFIESSTSIIVCHIELMKCSHIYDAPLSTTVSSLALNPSAGQLLWSETSGDQGLFTLSYLKMADMSGSNVHTINEIHGAVVTDIVYDQIHNTIFWADSKMKRIEQVDINGANRKLVLQLKNSPMSVNLFEDFIHWLNGQGRSASASNSREYVERYGMYGDVNKKATSIHLAPKRRIQTFKILHPVLQTTMATNACSKANCEHLCALTQVGFSCICQDGTKVRTGGRCMNSTVPNLSAKFVTLENAEEPSISWNGWIVFLIVFLGVVCTGLYIYCNWKTKWNNQFQKPWFYFQKLGYKSSTQTPSHPSLVPGEHHYENPANLEIMEPSLRMGFQNEISISAPEIGFKSYGESEPLQAETNKNERYANFF